MGAVADVSGDMTALLVGCGAGWAEGGDGAGRDGAAASPGVRAVEPRGRRVSRAKAAEGFGGTRRRRQGLVRA
ncbi:hypothetical protein Sgou_58280 [Streptomyces gougerotii]|uniref:Lipoprotein n=2 Tax=Streptomyces diastaticus group TaxID=2849069 RepID=A0ABQ1DF58_9ACTN|nr:hypothetical protein Srut_35980 [Streptomyces rutgersensis]GFH72358.1 hypothetical protein Sdia_31260 [Streptomyces diastaticus subsp. diastaticus]GFH81158.1 hypothetical protein Sgou_58280 [Streptomyces gougerotii]GGU27562.1 hypothetical protein GCM10015534_32870 [Streptomyces diastaticus subsp. diastaticus]